MGNSSSSPRLAMDVYETALKNKNSDPNKFENEEKLDIIDLYSADILQILLSFSDRREQHILINVIFSNLNKYQSELTSILRNILIKTKIDPYLITDFNKNNSILSNIEYANEYKFFFINIELKGNEENIKYLKSNTNNVIYALLFYVGVTKKDMLKSKNSNDILKIDEFIESFKDKKLKNLKFNTEDTYFADDEKLENIKYKNSYKFEEFNRMNTNNININNLTWKQYNDIFLKYLITNQLNFCSDININKKLYNADINNDIDLGKDDILNILTGCTLYADVLNAYNINIQSSKHTVFLGATNNKTYSKSKKVYIATSKQSSIFLINDKLNDMNVITMFNQTSEDHIKDKGPSTGKKIINAYVDQVHKSGF